MDKIIDPSTCPICGETNQCAQEIAKATGRPHKTCWCMTATFSAKLLYRVPAEAKTRLIFSLSALISQNVNCALFFHLAGQSYGLHLAKGQFEVVHLDEMDY